MSGEPVSAPLGDIFSLEGTILDRKYHVVRVVAEGGYGVVYRGRHLSLDMTVAIKFLRPMGDFGSDRRADLLTQFLAEARTLAKLRHPNVVAVLDSGVATLNGFDGGVPWIVLEWLEGGTLRDDLAVRRNRGGRGPGECMELMRPVLEAIADAHDVGIIHRDLKPSNIMLVPTATGFSPRVLDFGIAKIVQPELAGGAPTGETKTDSQSSAFTAASAAPEQLSGARTGPWTDVFALGLMMTELLADRAALATDDPTEHYRTIFAVERPTPGKHGVEVGAWEPVLGRALAVRPSDRQPNARVLLSELEAALPAADAARRTPGANATFAKRAGGLKWASHRSLGGGVLLVLTLTGAGAAVRFKGRGTSPSTAGPPAVAVSPGCTNAGCTTTLGQAAICQRGTHACVPLASEDCVVHAEPRDLERDDTVFVGTMFPRTGTNGADYGMWNHHAVELARRDFAHMMGPVPGGRARPLAVIECDDELEPTRAARHLVDEVGVPAVIGFYSGTEAMELANSIFIPGGVLTLVATNTNPSITDIPHPLGAPRLVVRTTYSNGDSASAIGKLVSDALEPRLRSLPAVGADARLRVALLRAHEATGSRTGSAISNALRFNGKPALENRDDYREISYLSNASAGSPELRAAVDAILELRPHVVIYEGGRTPSEGIVAPVESRWPKGVVRPRWVVDSELSDDVFAIVGKSAERRARFFGVTVVSETRANAQFVTHYRELFSEPVTRTESPNSAYDAFYLVAFASYTIAPDEPVTGVRLSQAMARLVPPGKPVEIGMDGIFGAYTALAKGEKIDVTGATGKLDFDLARGESAFDYSILCVGADASGRATTGVPSGLVYVAATRSLDGELHCP